MTCQSFFGRQLRQLGQQAISFVAEKAASDPRWRNLSRPSALAAGIFIMPAIAVSAAYFSRPAPTVETIVQHENITALDMPDVSAQIAQISVSSATVSRTARTAKNEPLPRLLARMGITDPKALDTVTKDRRHALAASMRKAGANQLVTAEVFPSGSIKTLSVYLENKGMGGKMFTLNRTSPESDVAISSRPFRFRMHETLVSGKVQGAIDRSLSRAGLPAVVIRQVHAIFDRDRDPLWSMNKGDQFWVVYEKKQANDHVVGYGKPLAVVLRRGHRTFSYYWLNDGSQAGSYYDKEGMTARRAFLRVPLDVRAVSSGFNRMRKHPITGVVRPHLGTDFSAPKGAVVRAASDGVVRKAGWGTGFGKHILIDHGNGYETVYAHLSVISKGIRPGSHVTISQQIGRVGMTGLATGPHLHYELRFHKQQINPMTAKIPTARALSSSKKTRLKADIAALEKKFDLPTGKSSASTAQADKADKGKPQKKVN